MPSRLLKMSPIAGLAVIFFTAFAGETAAYAQGGARRGGPMPGRGPGERPERAPAPERPVKEKAVKTKADKMAARVAEIDRFDRMSPEQRQRALDRLPAERRQRIEQGLAQYRAMNPEARERLRNFESMPQEQRAAVRQSFRRMQDLPQERRVVVRKELLQLRAMPPAEREERMQSEGFRKRFDANEQGLIRDTVANLPTGPNSREQD